MAGAAVLEDEPRAKFDTIEFPFTERSASLEFRHYVHEFPNMAGGEVEKQGRKCWAFTFAVPCHASDPFFPDIYPAGLEALTKLCGTGYTAPLVVPGIGTIRALLHKLDRKIKGSVTSGEDCTFVFIEDDLEPFRRSSTPSSRATLVEASASAAEIVGEIEADPEADGFDTVEREKPRLGSLLDLVNSVLAIRDQVSLYGARVGAMLDQIAGLARALHEALKGPDLAALRESIRSLWDAATQLRADVLQKGPGSALRAYVVPTRMSVGQIAQVLYKDASRGGELLSLNPAITDPYAVRATTKLIAYAA